MAANPLRRLRELDRERPNIPGEHWLALGGGLALWLGTRRHPSFTLRLLGSIAGTALVIRAVSGRDVPQPLDRLMPFRRDQK